MNNISVHASVRIQWAWRAVWLCIAMVGLGLVASVRAEVVHVAVAANFAGAFQHITTSFQADTGHTVVHSVGSTGKFYQQIKAGAPFDVLLAADDDTPKRLDDEGLTVKGQRYTYARGKLVLWSVRPDGVDARGAVLSRGRFDRLALADPALAPYGAAAHEVLRNMGLLAVLQPKIVQGQSIGQAHQFVATGNADLGFVALSQVSPPGRPPLGSWWVVPEGLYSPLLQDAVLLKRGEGNRAATALMAYLKGDKARAIIQSHGYDL